MELIINDVPFDRLLRAGSSFYTFETDFYAGDIRIAVVQGSRVIASAEIEVDPDVTKLVRDEYAAMVSEIALATTALYRLGNVTMPATANAIGIRSDLVTLELIRSNFEPFVRSVSRIADQPLRALQSTSVVSNIMQARRVDDRAINSALRSFASRPASVAELNAAPWFVSALGGRWIPKIEERHRSESLDVYENRAILGFIRWIDRTLASLTVRLSGGGSEGIHPASSALWAYRLSEWRMRLKALARRGVFADLSPEPILHSTSAFRMQPDYASAFAAMARMKAGLGAGSAAPAVPIDRTYRLYEIWCYINFLLAAANRFPHILSQLSDILKGCSTAGSLGTYLAQGYASTLDLTPELRLTYQHRISTKLSPDGSHTILIEAIPDITLTRQNHDGHCIGMVVVDPKYRAGASLMDGIRDLHVYRDAILGSDDSPLVQSAVAIAPRAHGFPEALENLPKNKPGVVVAKPGAGHPAIFVRLLDAAIRRLGIA